MKTFTLYMCMQWVMALLIVFTAGTSLKAQCPTQNQVYATFCAPYNADQQAYNNQTPTVVSLNMGPMVSGCSLTGVWEMEARGGIAIVGEPTRSIDGNGNQIFSASVLSLPGSFCIGRVILRFQNNTTCVSNNFPEGNERFVDVYKTYGNADLDQWYAANTNLGASFRIITERPPCVIPGDAITLSISAPGRIINGNTIDGCLSEGLGVDDIEWTIPQGWNIITKANDNSSITLRVPNNNNLPASSTVTVRVGRCNAQTTASIDVKRAPRAPVITSTPVDAAQFTGFVGGEVNIDGQSWNRMRCYSIQRPLDGATEEQSDFYLTAQPEENANPESVGFRYYWSRPDASYEIVKYLLGRRRIQVRARNGNGNPGPGSSGKFTLVVSDTVGGCNAEFAFFTINRILETYNGISGNDYNRIQVVGNPQPQPSTPGVNNCFVPFETYTFRVQNAPLNTPLTWANTSVSATQSYWAIEQENPQGAGTVALRPVRTPGNAAAPLSAAAKICDQNAVTFLASGETPVVAGSDIGLAIAVEDEQLRVRRDLPPPNNTTNWFPSQCGFSNYEYIWSFVGTKDGNPSNTVEAFADINTEGQILTGGAGNNPAIEPGIYTGTFRVRIRTRASNPCANGRCFFAEVTVDVNNQVIMPQPGGGGSGEEEEEPNTPAAMYLHPNPAQEAVFISLEGMQQHGRLRLLNAMQRAVAEVKQWRSGDKLSIRHLPKGFYTVEYMSPDGVFIGKKLIIE